MITVAQNSYCLDIRRIIFCLLHLSKINKNFNFSEFSGEIIDLGEDPLQSEPHRINRSKKTVNKQPCEKCEYTAK